MLTNLCFLLHFGRSISLSNGRSRVWLASTKKQETGQTGSPVFWGTWHWVILSKWGGKRFLLHARILKKSKFPRNNKPKTSKKKQHAQKWSKKNPTKTSKSNLLNQKRHQKKKTKKKHSPNLGSWASKKCPKKPGFFVLFVFSRAASASSFIFTATLASFKATATVAWSGLAVRKSARPGENLETFPR